MLTTHNSPPVPQAISWIWTLPVTWLARGRSRRRAVPAARAWWPRRGRREFPDLDRGADGQPAATARAMPIGAWKARKWVLRCPLVADHHELAGLVGGDQQRNASISQQRGEVRGVDRPQRPGVLGA